MKRANSAAMRNLVDSVEFSETYDLSDAKAKTTITSDGYLTAEPRISRTGIQVYSGHELGDPTLDEVRVYRPEGEVFHKAAMASLAWRPVTLDHPDANVNSRNWKQLAVGQVTGDVARDGEYIRVPLALMDQAAIDAVKSGQSQLSVGYAAKLVWGDGMTDDGEPYQAKQTEIRANHIAIVRSARGGSNLTIGDDDYEAYLDREFTTEQRKQAASKGQAMPGGGYPIKSEQDLKNAIQAIGRAKNRQATIAHIKKRARALGLTSLLPKGWGDGAPNGKEPTMATRTVDGVQIELEDKDGQILDRYLGTLTTKIADSDKKLGELTAQLAALGKSVDTKDGEIAAIKKQLADAEMTPDQLDLRINDRLDIRERAQRVLGDKAVVKGKADAQIKREVVASVLGVEFVKDWNDAQITGAFYASTKPATAQDGFRSMAQSFSGQPTIAIQDVREQAYQERNERLRNAWKKKGVA
jgi:hypothetical protein